MHKIASLADDGNSACYQSSDAHNINTYKPRTRNSELFDHENDTLTARQLYILVF